MIYALRKPSGQIFLVCDEWAVDVVLDEWDRGDWQLLVRKDVYDDWAPVRPSQVELLRARALRARRERQQLQGEMLP